MLRLRIERAKFLRPGPLPRNSTTCVAFTSKNGISHCPPIADLEIRSFAHSLRKKALSHQRPGQEVMSVVSGTHVS
eukprot:5688861-Prymnesium_polylepis.2